VRFSRLDETTALLDHNLPLNRYLPVQRLDAPAEALFRCPADRGITGETGGVGTGDRTAYEAFGTSYRANAALLAPPVGGGTGPGRGLHFNEITTAASRLVVMGDPVWYEVLESTGRMAAWHGRLDAGNLLLFASCPSSPARRSGRRCSIRWNRAWPSRSKRIRDSYRFSCGHRGLTTEWAQENR
jgi:hypothetical protein